MIICIPSLFEAAKIFPKLNFIKNTTFQTAEYGGDTVLISGVSKTVTTFRLTSFLQGHAKPSAIILAGVAGAYQKSELSIGDVVSVEKDYFVDEANFDNFSITTLHEKKFIDIKDNAGIFIPINEIKKVNSNTVSLIQSSDVISELYRRKYLADIENMEGASVGYIANLLGVKAYQLRAVSNFCGDIERQSWDIDRATKNLSSKLIELIENNIL